MGFGALDALTLVSSSNGLPVAVLSIAAGDNNIGNVDVVTLPDITIAAAQTLATVTTVGTITNVVHVDDNAGALSIDDGGGNISVDWGGTTPPIGAGLEATALRVTLATDSTGLVSVDDNGASLTVDNAALSVVGGGLEATALRVTLASDSTGLVSVDDNGGSLTIDNAQLSVVGSGTEATAMRVTIATDSTGVLSVDDNGASLTVDNAQLSVVGSGTEATALRVTIATDSTGVLSVDDNAGSLTVDNPALSVVGAGVVATAQRVTLGSDDPAVTALQLIDNAISGAGFNITQLGGAAVPIGAGTEAAAVRVTLPTDGTGLVGAGGNVAHDAADSGNPVKIGAKAYAFDGTAPQTAAAEADRVNLISDLQGIQYVQQAHPYHWQASVDYAAAQTNATIQAAPGAGLKLHITDLIISNGATAGNITLLDGSGGTVLVELYPPINGGLTKSFVNPIVLTANTLLAITSTTVTTHSVTVTGFIAP